MSGQLEFDFSRPGPARRGELPRDPLERGYVALRAEQAAMLRDLEARFGVILGRRVRVTLSGIDDEFEGKLVVDTLLPPSAPREKLRLRIGRVSFDHTDIETCIALGDPGEK
jgi:hypothetical protein